MKNGADQARPTRLERLGLPGLERLAVAVPLVFLAAVYYMVLGPIHPIFHTWFGFLMLGVVLAAAAFLFSKVLFRRVRMLQEEVEALQTQTSAHNQQLMSLHGADLALMRETRVVDALRRITELGARLSSACHASLTVQQPNGSSVVFTHPTIGPSDGPRCAIEAAPPLSPGTSASAMSEDRRLLSVPLAHLGTPIGTLQLARAEDAEPFSEVDEEVARMFATHGALVVQNDRLYDEVRALAIETERQALAREMHDSLAQVLAFVNTKAQAVELYLRNEDLASARQQMAELSAAAREVYADIRAGISALRIEVAGKRLGELIEEYAREFGDTARLQVQVDWNVDEDALALPPAAEVQLLRIVQEALANVRRHAVAQQVVIEASFDCGALVLVVADDGRGFESDDRSRDGRPRFGLQTMAERAKAVGGMLSVESAPKAGTRVRVTIPDAARPPAQGEP